jgi:hypothetical protein
MTEASQLTICSGQIFCEYFRKKNKLFSSAVMLVEHFVRDEFEDLRFCVIFAFCERQTNIFTHEKVFAVRKSVVTTCKS